jgi:hypothetical protein
VEEPVSGELPGVDTSVPHSARIYYAAIARKR